MITSIQTDTGNAVTSMEQTSTQAENTLVLTQAAGDALLEITESISQINERNLQIAAAAEQQAQVGSLVSIRDLHPNRSEFSLNLGCQWRAFTACG
jgi:methyl-accepting chemotaxis protein